MNVDPNQLRLFFPSFKKGVDRITSTSWENNGLFSHTFSILLPLPLYSLSHSLYLERVKLEHPLRQTNNPWHVSYRQCFGYGSKWLLQNPAKQTTRTQPKKKKERCIKKKKESRYAIMSTSYYYYNNNPRSIPNRRSKTKNRQPAEKRKEAQRSTFGLAVGVWRFASGHVGDSAHSNTTNQTEQESKEAIH